MPRSFVRSARAWASARVRRDPALAILVVAGLALRVVASVSWWPTIPTFADSWPYAYFAAHAPFADPQHPAGYSLFLAAIGVFTRQVAFTTVLQHLIGVATAVLLYGAVRRLVGARWPALLAAAAVMLGADQLYLEQVVASETLFTALLVASLYATVRALEPAAHKLRWASAAGAFVAAAMIARAEATLVAPVLAVTLLIGVRPDPRRWRAPVALLCTWVAVLICYGVTKSVATGKFEIGPSVGWQLYAAAATFADCKQFVPPHGTAGLCESTPAAERSGHDWYLWDPRSPAVRLFGRFGNGDDRLRAWAIASIEHQPGAYLDLFWHALRAYFVPSGFHYVPGAGGGLGEIDWNGSSTPKLQRDVITGMESYYARFHPHRHPRRVLALNRFQRIFRFGSTLLTLTTLMTLLGLVLGSRRLRVGASLFGFAGLALLIQSAVSGLYLGRYTVSMAGPMIAAAAITVYSLRELELGRRAQLEHR